MIANRRLGIIGYGWLGERIADAMGGEYLISATTTSQNKFDLLLTKGFNPTLVSFSGDLNIPAPSIWKELHNLDVAVITVPFPNKNSSVSTHSAMVANLTSFLGDFKGQLFFMSSTSVYPDAPKEYIEADLPPSEVVAEQLIRNTYPQVNILRLAGLMGGNRQLANYKVANLDHPVNHVHYADVCGVIKRMIEMNSTSQLYNVVAPLHPTKAEVIGTANNLTEHSTTIHKGRIISCQKLVSELNYQFTYPDPRLFYLY